MTRTRILAATSLAAVALLAGCGHPAGATPDQIAACKAALSARLEALASTGVVPSSDRPAECRPLNDTQLADVGKSLADG